MHDICQTDCPARQVLDLVANKWTVLVLRIISTKTRRYNEIQRHIPGISQKVLTGVLRNLEAHGIITRTVYPVIPPKVEYHITDLGKTLWTALVPIQEWAEGNIPHIVAARAVYSQTYTKQES